MKESPFRIQTTCAGCHGCYLEYVGFAGRTLSDLFNKGEFFLREEWTDKKMIKFNRYNYLLCCKCGTRFYPELESLMWRITGCNILKNLK
jgi:hypothetical protein